MLELRRGLGQPRSGRDLLMSRRFIWMQRRSRASPFPARRAFPATTSPSMLTVAQRICDLRYFRAYGLNITDREASGLAFASTSGAQASASRSSS